MRSIFIVLNIGGDKGSKKIAFICLFIVFIWTMPIYALDSCNETYNKSVNSTDQIHQNSNNHEKVYDQAVDLEDSTSNKYNDVQDLRLKIMEILEGIRLARDENEFRPEISQLMRTSSHLKHHNCYLICD